MQDFKALLRQNLTSILKENHSCSVWDESKEELRDYYEKIKGETLIYTSLEKKVEPRLVTISQTFLHHIVVVFNRYDVHGVPTPQNISITYNSLLCGGEALVSCEEEDILS